MLLFFSCHFIICSYLYIFLSSLFHLILFVFIMSSYSISISSSNYSPLSIIILYLINIIHLIYLTLPFYNFIPCSLIISFIFQNFICNLLFLSLSLISIQIINVKSILSLKITIIKALKQLYYSINVILELFLKNQDEQLNLLQFIIFSMLGGGQEPSVKDMIEMDDDIIIDCVDSA